MFKLRKNSKAFTLVEVFVVTLISTIVWVSLVSTFKTGNHTISVLDAQVWNQGKLRNLIEYFKQDIRTGYNFSVTTSAGSTELTFYQPGFDVEYSWTNSGIDAEQLIRQKTDHDAVVTTKILATGLTDVDFTVNGELVGYDITVESETFLGEDVDLRVTGQFTGRDHR